MKIGEEFVDYVLFYKLNPKDHWRRQALNATNDRSAKIEAHRISQRYNYSIYGIERTLKTRIL